MHAMLKNRPAARSAVRIEAVDHSHANWAGVLLNIARSGDLEKMRIDSDGWLSARQIVFVGFVDEKPVAHLSFHLDPTPQACIEAHVDSYGIDEGYENRGIENRLRITAIARARELLCKNLVGFDLRPSWE